MPGFGKQNLSLQVNVIYLIGMFEPDSRFTAFLLSLLPLDAPLQSTCRRKPRMKHIQQQL